MAVLIRRIMAWGPIDTVVCGTLEHVWGGAGATHSVCSHGVSTFV